MKKKLSLFAMFLCATLLALPNRANAQFIFTTNNGAITITGYFNASGALVIPDTINGLKVTRIGFAAFGNSSGLTSVKVGTNVINIGDAAFTQCYSLTNILIPASVTGIGTNAFQDCLSLASITLPGSVTNMGNGVFIGCSRLLTITVDPTNSFFSSTNGVLFNKNRTKILEFPRGVGGTYTIPQSVTNVGYSAFATSTRLTDITIPDSVRSISHHAFGGCTNLGSITLPDSVTIIFPYAFAYCSGLTNIVIGTNVTDIENDVFYGCSGLTSITIPGSVIAIGDYSFYGCTNLLTARIIGTHLFVIFGIMFPNCPDLTGVYFEGNAPNQFEDGYILAPDSDATVYYLPWTTGWPAPGGLHGSCPTALWLPQAQAGTAGFGAETNQFGFNITWANDQIVVVEACTNLASPDWQPVSTNTLTGGSSTFSDPDSTNYPGRFYRLRTP